MSLNYPPPLPSLNNIPYELRDYLQALQRWSVDIYSKLKNQDWKDIAVTTSAAAPSGGQDGDIHVRVNGASTSIYLNINGAWSAYVNP